MKLHGGKWRGGSGKEGKTNPTLGFAMNGGGLSSAVERVGG